MISFRLWPWWMITIATLLVLWQRVDPGLYVSHVICEWLSFQLSQIMLYCASFESYIRQNFGFFHLLTRIVCCLANARQQWCSYPAFLFKCFLNQAAPSQKMLHAIQFRHTEVLMVWGWQFIDMPLCSRANITMKKLEFHCFVPFEWLHLKTGHLLGWIWKFWKPLFLFCHLVGFHCLGGPTFSSKLVLTENALFIMSNIPLHHSIFSCISLQPPSLCLCDFSHVLPNLLWWWFLFKYITQDTPCKC